MGRIVKKGNYWLCEDCGREFVNIEDAVSHEYYEHQSNSELK